MYESSYQNVLTDVNHILRCEECANFHCKSEGDCRCSYAHHRLQNYVGQAWRHSYVDVGKATRTVSVRHNAILSTAIQKGNNIVAESTPTASRYRSVFVYTNKDMACYTNPSRLFIVVTLLIFD